MACKRLRRVTHHGSSLPLLLEENLLLFPFGDTDAWVSWCQCQRVCFYVYKHNALVSPRAWSMAHFFPFFLWLFVLAKLKFMHCHWHPTIKAFHTRLHGEIESLVNQHGNMKGSSICQKQLVMLLFSYQWKLLMERGIRGCTSFLNTHRSWIL